MRRLTNSESGLSLIEVLLVTGMVILMGMSFASIINNQRNSSKSLQQTLEANQITESIQAFLNNPANCAASFLGRPTVGTTPIADLRNNLGAIVFSPAGTLGDHVAIRGFELVGPIFRVPIINRDAIKLRVAFDKRVDSVGGPLKPREIDVLVVGGALITGCTSKTAETLSYSRVVNSTGGRAVTVNCPAATRIYSCGWRDDSPTKSDNRYFYPIAPTAGNPGGGCYCRDMDDGGNLYCYAVCCRN